MPTPPFLLLQPVPPDRVGRVPGLLQPRNIKTSFPKRSVSSKVEATAALNRWQGERTPPSLQRNDALKIKAQPLDRSAVTKLRSVAEQGLAPKAMEKHGVDVEQVFGSLFSALATHEYMKMQGEYKRRKRTLRAGIAVDQQWQAIVGEFRTAFAAAGMPGVDEATLDGFVKELNANVANRDYVAQVANSAVDAGTQSAITRTAPLTAAFVPYVATVIDPDRVITTIKDLCTDPIAEGSYTKHFSRSITLSVRIPYPCCSWSGCRWCHKTVTLAGVSVSMNVNVGYKVTCCGATAWGQTYADVCATIVGKRVCAACSATVTGVAGVSRTPVTSGCQYGLGVEAVLRCTLAGQTILNVTYAFGWIVEGPCPPAGACP